MPVTWLDVEQRSEEWRRCRLGIPTASQFDRIMTPTGKPSASAGKYLGELLSEWALGQEKPFRGTSWVQRGVQLEPMARAWLEFDTGEKVEDCGMALRTPDDPAEDWIVGASPDGLFADTRISELKVPSPWVHLAWVVAGGMPRDHVVQVQAQLWVTQAPVCEFLSLCPDIVGCESHRVTVEPDDALQEAIGALARAFCARLAAAKERLLGMGVEPWS